MNKFFLKALAIAGCLALSSCSNGSSHGQNGQTSSNISPGNCGSDDCGCEKNCSCRQ